MNHILLDDGSQVRWMDKSFKNFLNETIILYGERKSGKTVLIRDIMYILRHYISIPFLVSETEMINHDFAGTLPSACIKGEITLEWLERLLQFQKERSELYKVANNIEHLKSLFDRIKTRADSGTESECYGLYHRAIAAVNASSMEYDKKIIQLKHINDTHTAELVRLYKNVIRRMNSRLLQMELSNIEKACVQYVDFNPHMLLVIDDCAAKIKKWASDSPYIKEIFYNGRHYKITIIITAQDDSEIDPTLRKNTRVSAFMKEDAVASAIGKRASGFPPAVVKHLTKCARKIFEERADGENFRKLVYWRDSPHKYHYIVADIHSRFQMGCPSLWVMDERMGSNEPKISRDVVRRYLK